MAPRQQALSEELLNSGAQGCFLRCHLVAQFVQELLVALPGKREIHLDGPRYLLVGYAEHLGEEMMPGFSVERGG